MLQSLMWSDWLINSMTIYRESRRSIAAPTNSHLLCSHGLIQPPTPKTLTELLCFNVTLILCLSLSTFAMYNQFATHGNLPWFSAHNHTTIPPQIDSLLSVCGALSGSLFSLIEDAEAPDESLGAIRSEVNSIVVALGSLKQNFSDPLLSVVISNPLNTSLQTHYNNVGTCLVDCTIAVQRLDTILRSVQYCEGRYLINSDTGARLDIKSGEIALLKQQIAASRQAINLTLGLIAVYNSYTRFWLNWCHI